MGFFTRSYLGNRLHPQSTLGYQTIILPNKFLRCSRRFRRPNSAQDTFRVTFKTIRSNAGDNRLKIEKRAKLQQRHYCSEVRHMVRRLLQLRFEYAFAPFSRGLFLLDLRGPLGIAADRHYFRGTTMDIPNFLMRTILTPSRAGKVQTEREASLGLRNRSDAPTASARLLERKESSAGNYGLTNEDLRSVVERRFMTMNETHDRIRTEVLASYSPGMN